MDTGQEIDRLFWLTYHIEYIQINYLCKKLSVCVQMFKNGLNSDKIASFELVSLYFYEIHKIE